MIQLWILVLVKKGFIQEPEIFKNQLSAENRKKELLINFNRDYDEIDVFQKEISFNENMEYDLLSIN